jgi:hypothetical protein
MPSNPPATALAAERAKASTSAWISCFSSAFGGSVELATGDGAHTGSFDQAPKFTPPLCASWMNASAPWACTGAVTRSK